VHTFHGHVFRGYFSPSVERVLMTIERVLARFTDAIIAVSPQVKYDLAHVLKIAPEDKIRVIRLGFNFDWLEQIPSHRGWLRERLGVEESTLLVGMVGRLTAVKNPALIFRAFRELQNRGIDARLVVFGDGELRAGLISLARELRIQAEFVGWEADRAKIFSDLNLTCLASLNEGTPVAFIESLAAGVSVVGTRVGGVEDVVSDPKFGRLVSPGSQSEFAQALVQSVAEPTRIGSADKAEIVRRYSSDRLVSEIRNLYEELLSSDTRSPAGDALYHNSLASNL
jgi:glycosyltransferase involved in cell wall biosynthesis